MGSRELSEWMAYEQIEPFGEQRADLRAAIIAATVANALRGRKSRRRWKPADFMPVFARKRTATPDELLAKARAINMALGGKDLTRGNNR